MGRQVVSREAWENARAELLVQEKAATRARDALAAERRALPMVRVEKDYKFTGPQGTSSLAEVFEGRRQLIIYHFMFAPGATEGCEGCSFVIDNLGHLAHLHARDTTLAIVSDAAEPETRAFRTRMGWDGKGAPWYSVGDGDFNRDMGATSDEGRRPTVTVFLREGDEVFHTYTTQDRGGEMFLGTYHYLDITPLGRQEEGLQYPQEWWRHHDRYGA
jgi:predicted dithiol-disulfide oxidoreductase (DUF899 family)